MAKRGRPKGTTEYDEPKKITGHRMTPKAHEWIKAHKDVIEKMARWDYTVEFKIGGKLR